MSRFDSNLNASDYADIQDAIEEGVYHALKRMFDRIMLIASISWVLTVGYYVVKYWLHK